jgi:hypothetical protein
MNNMALERAQKWFSELEIRTQEQGNRLLVNRDDVDSLFGIGTIYETVLTELKNGLGYTRYCWAGKDREWLFLETI